MKPEPQLLRACMASALVPWLFGGHTLLEPFGRDQGIHATIAFALQEGLTTYRDVFNIKPPMTTATHWLALELFGHSYHAIRILDLLYVSAGMSALTAAILLIGGRTGLAFGSAVGFSAIYYSLGYLNHAQTDEWAALWQVFTFLFMAFGWRHEDGWRRGAWFALAGGATGIGFWYKYTVAAIAVLVFLPWSAREKTLRFRPLDLLWTSVGGVLAASSVAGVLMVAGAMDPFLEIQDFIRGYVSYRRSTFEIVWRGFLFIWQEAPLVALLLFHGIVTFATSALSRWTPVHSVALLMALNGMASAIAQGKGFDYHYLPFFIGMGMLIGWGLDGIHNAVVETKVLSRRNELTWAAVVVLTGVASGGLSRNAAIIASAGVGPFSTRDIALSHPTEPDFDFGATLAFSERFSEIRQPEETFFLWGYESQLYFFQRQPPLHRFPYSWPFIVHFHDGRFTEDLMGRLQAAPPDYIVVQHEDATPWVTGNRNDSRSQLREIPRLQAFIHDHYRLSMETERFDLWRRKGDTAPPSAKPKAN